jgi:hypothetical protein
MQTAYTKPISKSFDNVMTLQAAKDHLRILDDAQDTMVEACKKAAIAWAETRTERVFTESVYQIRIVPEDFTLVLPFPDFVEITKLESITGSTTATLYNKTGPVGILADYLTVDSWPNPAEVTVLMDQLSDVDYLVITASFGMGESIPEDITAAIKLLLGHFFSNPNEVVTGTIATQVPMGAEVILAMNAYKRFG